MAGDSWDSESESLQQLINRSPIAERIVCKLEDFADRKISVMRQSLQESIRQIREESSSKSITFRKEANSSSNSEDRLPLIHVPPVTLEKEEDKEFLVDCEFSKFGCTEHLVKGSPYETEHRKACKHRPLQCLMFPSCRRMLMNKEFVSHVKEHYLVPTYSNEINFSVILSQQNLHAVENQYWSPKWLYAYFHHFFVMMERNCDGVWYIWVWLLGSIEEAKKFTVKLKIYNGFSHISKPIPVHSIRIPAAEIHLQQACCTLCDRDVLRLTDLSSRLYSDIAMDVTIEENTCH